MASGTFGTCFLPLLAVWLYYATTRSVHPPFSSTMSTMTAPSLEWKTNVPLACEDKPSSDHDESVDNADSIVQTVKNKTARFRPHASRRSQSTSTESDPVPASSPSIRSRVLSESEISSLDLGPSLDEANAENERMDVPLLASYVGRGANSGSKPAFLRSLSIDDLESQAVTSASISVHDEPLAQRPRQRPEALSRELTAELFTPESMQNPVVPVYGDLHHIGYGYGFCDGVAGFPSAGLFPNITDLEELHAQVPESSRRGQQSGEHQFMVPARHKMVRPKFGARKEDLVRREQSWELFLGVALEDRVLDGKKM